MNDAHLHPPKPRRDDWCTPPEIVERVRRVFGGSIGLDPCSNANSVVHAEEEYRLPEHDGLHESWNWRTIYVNPPYGRGIGDWLCRCAMASMEGSGVIALIPAAPDTKAWRDQVECAQAVCFVHGRITFLGAPSAAPMPSAIVYWGSNWVGFAQEFQHIGGIWRTAK